MKRNTDRRAWLVTMIMGMALALPTIAAAAEPDHLTIEEITVTDSLLPDGNVTELGGKTVEQGKNFSLPDVLKNEADIDIRRRASIGDTADILAIRGFSGNRIMLNVNGRPVNAAGVVGGYYIDWGTIPMDNIEKIEVIRGGSSVRYGNNALGGVINVETKRPTTEPTLTLFADYGGGDIDNIENFRLNHTYKMGPVGYAIAASYQKADPFLWNNDFTGLNLGSTLYIDMPLDGQMTIGGQYSKSDRGFIMENRVSDNPDNPNFYVPKTGAYPLAFGETFSPYSGLAFAPGPGASWNKVKYYLDFGYEQPVGDGVLDAKLYMNHEDRKEKNYSSHLLVSSYADGQLVLDREVASDRSHGGSLEFSMPWGEQELLAGVDYKILAYGETKVNYIDTAYNGRPYSGHLGTQAGESWGWYGQDTWNLDDHLIITGGLRYDTFTNKAINGATDPDLTDNSLSPKLTVTYGYTDADTLTMSVYQAVRTPGLPETYWWRNGGLTNGQPLLKPEKNKAGEAIYRHDFSRDSSLRLSAYYYQVDDYIMFRVSGTSATRGAYNIDQAVLHGGSIEARTALSANLTGKVTVNYQKSKKKGDALDTAHLSDELDYLPEWKGSLELKYQLPYRAVLDGTVKYVGDSQVIYQYLDGAPPTLKSKLMDMDSYTTVDLSLKAPVLKDRGEVSLYVENLFDKQYEQRFGYPLPGRIVGVSVKTTF